MANLPRDQWSFGRFNELGLQEFQALIVNYACRTVLVKREDSHLVLPAYVGDEDHYESSLLPEFVTHKIGQEIGMTSRLLVLRQVWRKEMYVVKNREHYAVEKAVVLVSSVGCEKHNRPKSPTEKGYEWIGLDEAEIYHLFPDARRIVAQELELVLRAKIPLKRLKWQRPGWMEAKSTWLQDVLLSQEKAKLSKPLAMERSTPLGIVIEAETTRGRYFLKCTPPWQNDAAYTEILSRIAPKYVAPPLAVDTKEQVLLTRDYGRILVPALFDKANQIIFTRDFVKLQCLVAERIEDVVHAGMPDCREDALLKRMDWASKRPLLDAIANREEYAESVQFFRSNLDQLKREVRVLYATEVPATVTHNDLYLSNVYKKQDGEGYMFFDWVEGYVSHPMASMLDGLSLSDYINEWEKYLHRRDLEKVHKSAQKIRVLIRLALMMVEAENLEEPEATEALEDVAERLCSVFECFSDAQ